MINVRFSGLDGRVSLVTGAARGIGRAIADALREQGSRVAYLDVVTPDDAPQLEISGASTFIACDVSNEGDVDKAFTRVERVLGPVEIVVNNAAVLRTATVEETTLALWQQTLDVNLTGAFLIVRRALPSMRDLGFGRIINIGSNAGKMGGIAPVVAYAASKAALHNLARSIAIEQARHGITANAVAACLIETDMTRVAGVGGLVERIPVGRMGSPEDVAYAVLFLASPEASYITGEVMDVNGGFYLD